MRRRAQALRSGGLKASGQSVSILQPALVHRRIGGCIPRRMPSGAPRIRGFEYRGLHRYSLTICAHGRRRPFTDRATVIDVLEEIQDAARICRFRMHAYCFMPDHLHLLVESESETSDLCRFVSRWKQRTGFNYSRRTGTRLWQVGFFDHVLRSDESTRRHALYVVDNPIRAGLVRSVGEYPFAWSDPCWMDIP